MECAKVCVKILLIFWSLHPKSQKHEDFKLKTLSFGGFQNLKKNTKKYLFYLMRYS